MPLPADLLGAIAHADGGRVVMVTGAGCSFEEPTALPLARECALDVHRLLILDGVLTAGQCTNPEDLSCVTDAVRLQLGTQAPVVERLPINRFRNAQPNDGHLRVAAMMREEAIRAVVTLNFDLAFSTALAQVGAEEVITLNGPQDHHRMGAVNLIYLHRNAHADPEDWILSTEAMENAWRGQWEGVIASAMLAAPVTVFAGLGTPAAVLI